MIHLILQLNTSFVFQYSNIENYFSTKASLKQGSLRRVVCHYKKVKVLQFDEVEAKISRKFQISEQLPSAVRKRSKFLREMVHFRETRSENLGKILIKRARSCHEFQWKIDESE